MIPRIRRFISQLRKPCRQDRRFQGTGLAILILWAGCTNSSTSDNTDFLIRVRDSVVTVGDYQKAFEIAKSAYSHNEMQNPAAFKAVQIRLLNQLTEELLLTERAKELNIRVSETEIDAAVEAIKKDYPDGHFEKMLLEHAVSYPIWKQRLERRMLMEKIIEEELNPRITIEPDEILAYYDTHIRPKSDATAMSGESNRIIVLQVRRKKAEDAYGKWIQNLEKQYPIEINRAQWEKIARH